MLHIIVSLKFLVHLMWCHFRFYIRKLFLFFSVVMFLLKWFFKFHSFSIIINISSLLDVCLLFFKVWFAWFYGVRIFFGSPSDYWSMLNVQIFWNPEFGKWDILISRWHNCSCKWLGEIFLTVPLVWTLLNFLVVWKCWQPSNQVV